MAQRNLLTSIQDLTPELWFDYLDARLETGISPITVNGELRELQQFLHYLNEQGCPICRRMLRVEPLDKGPRLPRDVPIHLLRRLLEEIETEATSTVNAGHHRMGVLDRAWAHLMLHSGLRLGEVRRLRLPDLDLEGQRVRIEQSKGLRDRIVCLSSATVDALRAYLEIRGPATTDHVFLFRHQPLSPSYCGQRLRTYARRCGVRVTPHSLRHSCATLLLNAGAPVLTVQTILGHKFIDTTLDYARLYDGTVAADYYRAIAEVESRFEGKRDTTIPPDSGQLLALVDALHAGTLNDVQRETVQALRAGILALAEDGSKSRAQAV
jgi:integrase